MNNLASLLASPGTNSLSQGKAWAEKGRQLAQTATEELSSKAANQDQRFECETALAVISFNLGMLNEVSRLAWCSSFAIGVFFSFEDRRV